MGANLDVNMEITIKMALRYNFDLVCGGAQVGQTFQVELEGDSLPVPCWAANIGMAQKESLQNWTVWYVKKEHLGEFDPISSQ